MSASFVEVFKGHQGKNHCMCCHSPQIFMAASSQCGCDVMEIDDDQTRIHEVACKSLIKRKKPVTFNDEITKQTASASTVFPQPNLNSFTLFKESLHLFIIFKKKLYILFDYFPFFYVWFLFIFCHYVSTSFFLSHF